MPDKAYDLYPSSARTTAERISEYNQHYLHIEEQRQEWETHWSEITDYILPRRGFYSSKGFQANKGEKRHDNIIDGTATRALRVLAAGMQGGLTSPARPWFRIGLVDEELEQFKRVKLWLADVEKILYRTYSRSNFYHAIHSTYTELGGFGTAALFQQEHPQRDVHFIVLTAGEYCLALNQFLEVDTIYRRMWRTVRQMIERWGDNVSDEVQRAAEKTPYEYYEILNLIRPRGSRNAKKLDSANMPWESIYLEYDNPKDILSEGGYNEFPAHCPRWDVTGSDVYGRSPGMDVLADVKALQEYASGNIRAIHLRNDPPILAPSYLQSDLRTYPGGVNYFATGQDPGGLKPLYEVQPDVQHTLQLIQDTRDGIREGLYNDLFLMILERPNMTATEVIERSEEKLLMLGPVIERQMHELLDPCIHRTFSILSRKNALPPPPEEIQGIDYRVEYISLLAQAQKRLATANMRGFVGFVADIAQARQLPDAWDKVNIDKAIDAFGDAYGVPADIIMTDDEVEQIRRARQAAMERERMRREAGEEIGAMKTLADTPTGGETALTDLMRAGGG